MRGGGAGAVVFMMAFPRIDGRPIMREIPFTDQLDATDGQFLEHLRLPRGVAGDGVDGDPAWAGGLAQARTSIARGTFVTELSTAFALTGDAKYARKAMQLMRSFVAKSPFVLDPRFVEDHDTYFGGPGDSTQL